MQKLVIIFLFVIQVTVCYCQGKFEPGSVVNHQGDTLKGLIKYRHWDISPQLIEFKKSEDASVSIYKPSEGRSFAVHNENYISAVVDVDISPFKINELQSDPLPVYVKDTVFLQVLVNGDKKLFFFKSQEGKAHFFIYDGDYRHLVYKKYLHYNKELLKNVVAENNGYKKTLAVYLNDCNGIPANINRAVYNTNDLSKLFAHYYKCTNKPLAKIDERKEGRLEFGFLAGASLATVNFESKIAHYASIEHNSSLNPALGIFLDINILRSNNWRITNDIFYSSLNFEGEGFDEGLGTGSYDIKTSFNLQYMKTHHMLQINIVGKDFIFLKAGFATGILLSDDWKITAHYTTTSNARDLDFVVRTAEIGFTGGFGVRFRKFNIEGRYENSSGLSNYGPVGARTTRLYALVKYRF